MKEIEQVLLNINVDLFIKKIEEKGAVFENKGVEKQYNYDFMPIKSEFSQHKNVILSSEYNNRERGLAICRLERLLFDADDLLKSMDFKYNFLGILKDKIKTTSLTDYLKQNEGNLNETWFNNIEFVFQHLLTNPNKWARIKLLPTGKTSVAVKQIMNRKIEVINGKEVRTHNKEDVFETEIIADDFESAKKIMESLGYFPKSYTQRERISYLYKNEVKIDIDIYPHIPPFVEIEASSSGKIEDAINELSLNDELMKTYNMIGKTNTLNHDDIYDYYGLDIQKEFSIL